MPDEQSLLSEPERAPETAAEAFARMDRRDREIQVPAPDAATELQRIFCP
jgi:hypothetical protein